MVLIVVKQNEDDQFLYECALADSNDFIIRQVVELHNFRKKLLRFVVELEKITSAYNPDTRSFVISKEEEDSIPKIEVDSQSVQTINKTVDDTKMYILKVEVSHIPYQ